MPWNLDCDLWVSWSFLQNNNHQAVNEMKNIYHYYIIALSLILYCTWFATNSQSDLVTSNSVIIYIYIYMLNRESGLSYYSFA